MLEVRTARIDEFDQVMTFYARMIDEMRGTEFDVCWEHGVHPSLEFLRASVEAGQVYVGVVSEDGAVAGDDAGGGDAVADGDPQIASAMVLNHEGANGYEHVPWRVQADLDEVLVVHVLATLPAYHGRGFARAMLQAGIDVARAAGMKAVRLDTFPFNVRARRLYESCGYADLGTYPLAYDNVDDGSADFVMYEYAL